MQTLISSFLTMCALMGWFHGGGTASGHVRPSVRQITTAPSASPSAAPSSSPIPSTSSSPSAPPSPSPATVLHTPAATPAVSPATGATEIASAVVCPGQTDPAATVAALTCLTNNARKFHGLSAVSDNQALLDAAATKDHDMAACGYGHTACGHPFDYWIKAKGYTGSCTGENIAMGQATPHDVFVAWMNSTGHRANILNGQYRDLGVAETAGSQGPLWVMELGGC